MAVYHESSSEDERCREGEDWVDKGVEDGGNEEHR